MGAYDLIGSKFTDLSDVVVRDSAGAILNSSHTFAGLGGLIAVADADSQDLTGLNAHVTTIDLSVRRALLFQLISRPLSLTRGLAEAMLLVIKLLKSLIFMEMHQSLLC